MVVENLHATVADGAVLRPGRLDDVARATELAGGRAERGLLYQALETLNIALGLLRDVTFCRHMCGAPDAACGQTGLLIPGKHGILALFFI